MLVLCLLSLHRYASLYLITDRRVELVNGLIAKSSREIRIQDIRAINVSRQGILGLFGIGTVEFASAGSDGVEVAFDKVWNAGEDQTAGSETPGGFRVELFVVEPAENPRLCRSYPITLKRE